MQEEVCVIISCVNYADFLRITLPAVCNLCQRPIVITAPDDEALTFSSVADVVITSAWYENGAKFNKGAAIREGISLLRKRGWAKWILILDADILLPSKIKIRLEDLDAGSLYSARRRSCMSPSDFEKYRTGIKGGDEFPVEMTPIIDGKAWGRLPTANPVGLSGYFHLYHSQNPLAMPPLRSSKNASGYDVGFALRFPDEKRKLLPFDVLHLGESKANWEGRVTPYWPSPLQENTTA